MYAFDAHVGARIRMRRHALGLSRRQLAQKLDCDEDHVAGLEDGRRRITGDSLIALAYALGVPLTWFFDHPRRMTTQPRSRRR